MWALIGVALLAVLTVFVVLGFNSFGGDTGDTQVPDVRGQASADAIAALQNKGFKTRTLQKPDSTIPPDHVISTDPGANASVRAGDAITVSVSTGPEQREVPDVSSLSYADAVAKLKAAGFSKFTQANSPSTPELLGKVIGTNPPANQSSAITSVITVIVGVGNQIVMPDVTGMFWTDAEPRLRALGWTGVLDRGPDVDAGASQRNKIVYQSPPAGTGVNRDGTITLKFGQ